MFVTKRGAIKLPFFVGAPMALVSGENYFRLRLRLFKALIDCVANLLLLNFGKDNRAASVPMTAANFLEQGEGK